MASHSGAAVRVNDKNGLPSIKGGIQTISGILAQPAPVEAKARVRESSVVRFDVHQRIQHILMFTSFLTLAFTGLPQKFHAWDVSQGVIAMLGGLEMAQYIHHVAAYVMLFDCLYHAVYLIHALIVRHQLTALQMIPMPKDVLDAFQMFKYFLGFSDQKPRFGRFSYLEKFDYWAVFWGIAIIGGSGIILLFPVQVSSLVPGGIVPVALAAHSDEAVLAVSWIFVVHFFYAHFAPAIFPFNTAIFTGRVAKERYAEEHPLEYEWLVGADERRATPALPVEAIEPVPPAAPAERREQTAAQATTEAATIAPVEGQALNGSDAAPNPETQSTDQAGPTKDG